MSHSPSPNPATNPQRDAQGRFAPGNNGGPGNPFARHVAKLRAALVNSVSEADMEQLADDLRIQAKLGNMAAIKLLFLYMLGKPTQPVNPDTLDIEEWKQLFQPIPQIMKEMPKAMMSVPVETASRMVQAMQPCMEKAVGEVMALPQAEYSQLVNEASNGDNACQDVPASPSPNGGNGRNKTKPSPSPNGGSSRPKPLPPWLMKIADKARILSRGTGKGRRRGG
jgi:hypothetical protein